jgi:hypothetical protein
MKMIYIIYMQINHSYSVSIAYDIILHIKATS